MLPRFRFAVLFLVGVVGCGGKDSSSPPDAMPPDGPQTTEVVCEELPPISSGTCEVTPGGATTLLKGIVLTPATLYRGGQVAIDAGGQITCVGCDCAAGGETVVTCPDGAISPGLINSHDHITFTQNQPYTDTGERYEDRQQWRKAQDGHAKISASGGASRDQVSWGELRFLLGGATSIVGSGGADGLLRNLDTNQQEGLAQTPVEYDTFPLDDSGGKKRTGDCNYGGSPTTASSLASVDSYVPHTAEGIDDTARNEFLCESSDNYDTMDPGRSNNLLLPKTALIHAIGLTPADYGAMASSGTGLIWSPRSNITLYGDTARVTTAHRLGVEIALGTDWISTGSMNLLRELKCADSVNQTYLHYFSDVQLWQMVTSNAAALTATDDAIGLLAAGKVADISIFNAHGKTFRAVIDAEPQDVVLVMRGGKPLYGDTTLIDALAGGDSCDALDVCGTGKQVCLSSEIGKTLAQLTTSVGSGMYPAFACGQPQNEPSCLPERPTAVNGSTTYTGMPSADDNDGDGIPNASDKCPDVFDPIRPLDDGVQADADGDGVGDACDPCPLDADTDSCTSIDPNDRDHDGVANDVDNCPDVANDQTDSDMDGKGDVCDACPMAANPGQQGCPATIYDIKQNMVPLGTPVRVSNALVTGVGSNGFFVQVKETDAGYSGSAFSGLFVFTGTGAPTLANANVGARVTIDGRVASFVGQIELDTVTSVTVDNAGPEAAPAPIAVAYADIKTGALGASQLESVIVSLGASDVTANDANFGEYSLTPDGTAADTLIADDFLFAPDPLPAVGTHFSAITGILAMRQSASKLEPRDAGDLTLGPPGVASLSPALSFARVGTTTNAPTFPTPLTVTLTGPAQGDTVVTLSSGNGTALTVSNVTIPNGQTSATVPVTALVQNAAVDVTASLSGQMVTSQVRVLGATEAPTSVTLSPSDASVAVGGSVDFTVTLDIPALSPTQVGISVNPSNAGNVPGTVTVAANQISKTFTYMNQATSGMATVTASFNATTSNATVTVSTGANHLVINEVDYDQASTDAQEFIEIYNPTGSAINLTGKLLVLINGSGSTAYDMVDLSTAGSLPSHGYLVIAGSDVSVMAPAIKLDPGWTTNAIQNGAPDGIALIDDTTHTLIDAISYEGSVVDAELPGFATPQTLVEGTAATAADVSPFTDSICRSPDGQDTDDASVDWKTCAPSAGTANP